MNLSKIMASRYRSRFSILFCIWVWHIKGVWHIILTVLIFLSYKNSKYGSCHINPGERRNFSFYLGNTGSAQVKFSCFSKIFWGLVWLIRLHLNATVNLPSCGKTSKFSPQTLGEARSYCVQCLGSGAAPCDRGTCCSWVSWDPSLPLPGLGGPRQGWAGPPLSLHKMSSCALAPSVWAAGWGQGGSLHSRNGVGGPICPTQLCAAGAQQVYMHRTGGAGGPRGTVLVSECEVWFKLSWLHSGGSSAVGFWGWFLLSPIPLHGGCIVCQRVFAKVRIQGVTWCFRKGDAVSKWQKGVVAVLF